MNTLQDKKYPKGFFFLDILNARSVNTEESPYFWYLDNQYFLRVGRPCQFLTLRLKDELGSYYSVWAAVVVPESVPWLSQEENETLAIVTPGEYVPSIGTRFLLADMDYDRGQEFVFLYSQGLDLAGARPFSKRLWARLRSMCIGAARRWKKRDSEFIKRSPVFPEMAFPWIGKSKRIIIGGKQ